MSCIINYALTHAALGSLLDFKAVYSTIKCSIESKDILEDKMSKLMNIHVIVYKIVHIKTLTESSSQ